MLTPQERNKIRVAITALARQKIAAGMSAEQAIEDAGREFRETQKKEHDRKLAELTEWLQGRSS